LLWEYSRSQKEAIVFSLMELTYYWREKKQYRGETNTTTCQRKSELQKKH
jgi:hypothetical protein